MMPRQPSCLCGECRLCRKREQLRALRARDPEGWRARHRAYRAANPEQFRSYEEKRSAERDAAYWREYRGRSDQHRLKSRARGLVSGAVRTGRLVRGTCEVCDSADVQAHHDDYTRPLDVRWLCRTHHGQAHWKVTA